MTGTELLSQTPAEHLADLIRQAQNWAEVEEAIASNPNHKAEAWELLDTSAKARIKELKQRPAVLPLELVGHRVFVTAGTYRSEGEGVVEVDRGVGTLRMLEVRMSYRTIQVVSIDNIQLIEGRAQ